MEGNRKQQKKYLETLGKMEDEIEDLIKDNEIYLEEKAVLNIKRNSKYFFSFAKKKSNSKHSLGPLKMRTKSTDDEKKMAEIFKNQYESVFSTPKDVGIITQASSFKIQTNITYKILISHQRT